MSRLFWIALVTVGLSIATCEPANAVGRGGGQLSSDAVLTHLMTKFWDAHVADLPLFANIIGDNAHRERIDALSEDALAFRRARFDAAIADLQKIDRTKLTSSNQLNRDVFEWMLKNERALLDLPTQYMPITGSSGFDVRFMQTLATTPFGTTNDYENYLARISKFGSYTDEAIALMRKGIKTGYVHPCESLTNKRASIEAAISYNVGESFAYRPIADVPTRFGRTFTRDVQTRAKAIIGKIIIPAQQRYLQFYTNEYYPACRQTYGLATLKGGAEAYAQWVRYYATDANATPDAVHRLGLAEVARLRVEMKKVIKEVGFNGDLKSFFGFVRKNGDFHPKDEAAYLARAAIIAKKIDGQLPRYFSYMPRNTFRITTVPAGRAATASLGYYQPGSAADGIPGQYFINTHDLPNRSFNDLPVLGLHEASPGHHFQLSIQQELDSLPRFRRGYYISAFGEGWGLYSEYLGEEMGIYDTPYERFGRLTFEIWRACRLVVDTGIHAMGWSRQRAINYMTDNSALDSVNIMNEVDRYITNPGQAISYKLGELKIKEVRARAEAKLGEAFSLRDFHAHLLLGGAMPLQTLETYMNGWIDDRKAEQDQVLARQNP